MGVWRGISWIYPKGEYCFLSHHKVERELFIKVESLKYIAIKLFCCEATDILRTGINVRIILIPTRKSALIVSIVMLPQNLRTCLHQAPTGLTARFPADNSHRMT